ncbi:DUF2997 domain-containing protein [Pseudogracilibacillus sp. SO30301A]|uniref:DUF2997 domain-containing protein n=1 Tax=Pseudogracilibacillus sp. SO30301A TaxID=3098291 RepID=UPI00300DD49C
MEKKIRLEITATGEIRAKTIGMNDEECLDYVEILESLLDAETVDSKYTEEFLLAQQLQYQEEQTPVEQQMEVKGD